MVRILFIHFKIFALTLYYYLEVLFQGMAFFNLPVVFQIVLLVYEKHEIQALSLSLLGWMNYQSTDCLS
jgi:hypothetical protein